MKKTDKELEQKLEQELEQYLNNIEVPDLNIEKQQELRKLVEQNKQKSKRITLWRRITAVASAVCLIALMIIPTVFLCKSKPVILTKLKLKSLVRIYALWSFLFRQSIIPIPCSATA